MKKLLLTTGILLSLCTGAWGARPGSDGQHERKAMQGLRPTKRPQLEFTLLKAARYNDSCRLVLEIEIPARAIRRRERMQLAFALLAPGADQWRALDTMTLCDTNYDEQTKAAPAPAVKPDRNRAEHLYYSVKFPAEKWMDDNAVFGISRTLQKGTECYTYDDLRLPVQWNTCSEAWRGSDRTGGSELTDRLPEGFVPDTVR